MSANGVSLSFLLLLLLGNLIYYSQATTSTAQVNGSATTATSNEMVPLNVVEMKMMLNISRRRLNGFQICAPCTCCGGAHGTCLPSPCCYAINCNIPNRPFGFCSFTPKTCNCFGCHL